MQNRSVESKNKNYFLYFDQPDNRFVHNNNPIICELYFAFFLANNDFGSTRNWSLRIKLTRKKLKWCCIVNGENATVMSNNRRDLKQDCYYVSDDDKTRFTEFFTRDQAMLQHKYYSE